jgi:transcriptional regulator NrdR family protein
LVKSTQTDKEIQDSILFYLWQEGAWGENYTNYEKMKRRLGMVVKNNGKNTDKQLKKLVNDRMVLKLKQGRTYSLNHLYRQTIEQRLIDADFTI